MCGGGSQLGNLVWRKLSCVHSLTLLLNATHVTHYCITRIPFLSSSTPQEDPKTLLKVDLPLPKGQVFEALAWGPDGTIAAALGEHIHFIDSKTGQVCGCMRVGGWVLFVYACVCLVWCGTAWMKEGLRGWGGGQAPQDLGVYGACVCTHMPAAPLSPLNFMHHPLTPHPLPSLFIPLNYLQVLEVLHAHEGAVKHMVWAPKLVDMGGEEPAAVLASSSTDRRVRIWRSPK